MRWRGPSKSPGPPSVADRALWSLGYRPTKVSKFGTSLAVLRPELPSNRWTRALRAPWVLATPGRREADVAGDWGRALAG